MMRFRVGRTAVRVHPLLPVLWTASVLCGGGAGLRGIDEIITRRTGIVTLTAENPDETPDPADETPMDSQLNGDYAVSGGGLLLSSMLAGKLKLQVGDKVFAYFFENNVRARRFTVSGIFETNLTEFDEKLVFADLSTIHALYGWDAQQFSGAEVILRDMKTIDGVAYDIIRGMPRQDSNGASH